MSFLGAELIHEILQLLWEFPESRTQGSWPVPRVGASQIWCLWRGFGIDKVINHKT